MRVSENVRRRQSTLYHSSRVADPLGAGGKERNRNWWSGKAAEQKTHAKSTALILLLPLVLLRRRSVISVDLYAEHSRPPIAEPTRITFHVLLTHPARHVRVRDKQLLVYIRDRESVMRIPIRLQHGSMKRA